MTETGLDAIAEFCQKHHITRMVGYANPHTTPAGRENSPEFLVDFEPGHIPGYFDMFGGPGLIGMEEELALMLGKEAAYLHSATGISPSLRQKALDGDFNVGEPLYEAAKKA